MYNISATKGSALHTQDYLQNTQTSQYTVLHSCYIMRIFEITCTVALKVT